MKDFKVYDTPTFVLNVASEWQLELARIESPYTIEVDVIPTDNGIVSRMIVCESDKPVAITNVAIPMGQAYLPETLSAQLRMVIQYVIIHEPLLTKKL